MQSQLGKESDFREGIETLIDLRNDLFGQITSIVNTYPRKAFDRKPFAGAEGYHSKTLSYSMWHIFRIEDITAHTLIRKDSQVLFTDGWLKRTKNPIITTGNEQQGQAIAAMISFFVEALLIVKTIFRIPLQSKLIALIFASQ